MKIKEDSRDDDDLVICPKCGFEIPTTQMHRYELSPARLRYQKMRPVNPGEAIVVRGNAALEVEAGNRGWSVFGYVTPDVGTDYVIAKGYGAIMIQLKTSTIMDNRQYHVTVDRFSEGPLGFIIYNFQGINVFFIIPSTEFWEIPRFKKLKSKVFDYGSYSDTMSYEKAKEVMGDYENEKGWELLERLTTLEGLAQAIKDFNDKQKRHKR